METTGTVIPSPDFFCLLALCLFLGFVFGFCFQKVWKVTFLLGTPQQSAAPALWLGTASHSVAESPGHSKVLTCALASQLIAPKNSSVNMWRPVLCWEWGRSCDAQWELRLPEVLGSVVTAWEVSKKGICQLHGKGSWNLVTSNHQLTWRADTPVPCMFYKRRVNLCGGHHQSEIRSTPDKNVIWSLKSQIRSVTVEARFMENFSLKQSLPRLQCQWHPPSWQQAEPGAVWSFPFPIKGLQRWKWGVLLLPGWSLWYWIISAWFSSARRAEQ